MKNEIVEKNQSVYNVFNVVPSGIATFHDRNFTYVNQAFCDMVGFSEKDLLNKGTKFLYYDDKEYSYIGKTLYKEVDEKGSFSYIGRYIKKDKSLIHVRINAAALIPNDSSKGVILSFVNITDQVEKDNQLQYQVRLETARSQISNELLFSGIGDYGTVLGILGIALNTSRAAIFSIKDDKLHIKHHWSCNDTISPDKDMKFINLKPIRWWLDTQLKDGVVSFQSYDDLPPDDEELINAFIDLRIQSLLAVPIYTKTGSFWGFLGVNEPKIKRVWLDQEIDFLKSISSTLTFDIDRNQVLKNLQDSKAFMRTILDSMPTRIFWKDRDCVYLGGNKPFIEDAGLQTPEDIVGKSDYDLAWKDENAEAFQSDDRAVMESGVSRLNFEEPQLQDDGTVHWLLTNKFPLRDAYDKVIGVVGSYDDITELKKTREDIELTYNLIVNSPMTRIVWDLDEKMTILDMLQNGESILGYTQKDIKEKQIFYADMIHPEDKERVMAEALRNDDLKKDFFEHQPYRILTKNSEVKWILDITQARKKSNQEVLNYEGLIVDITKQKLTENALMESEVRMSTFFDSSPTSIFVIGDDGADKLRIQDVNPMVCQSSGYTRQELIGQSPDILFESQNEYERVYEHCIEQMGKDGIASLESRYMTKNGAMIPIYLSSAHLGTNKEQILFNAIDISEHKKANERIRQVEDEKHNALERLVAGMAHEINTPLGISLTSSSYVIEKYTTLMEEYKSGKFKRSSFETMMDSIGEGSQACFDNLQRAGDIIRSFKQIAVDQSAGNIKPINLEDYVNDILISTKSLWKRDAFIEVISLEKVYITTSPGPLIQVITNLINNSLLHGFTNMESGHITIELKNQEPYALIIYRDNGSGIKEEVMDNVFEPFYTTKPGEGGSGLGMYICRELIREKMKGSITLNPVDQGVELLIKLPSLDTE